VRAPDREPRLIINVAEAAALAGVAGPALTREENGARARAAARLEERDARGERLTLYFPASIYTASASFMRGLLGPDPARYELDAHDPRVRDVLRAHLTLLAARAKDERRHPLGASHAERRLLDLSADLWNTYTQLEGRAETDDADFQAHVNALQRIIALRVARRVDPDLWTQHP
jgi:hypothetical protein